ncbi:MAG: glutaredoxin [Myxococcales bacterium]|nr:glutaredoxin [Myxococcota bacterium]MDW8280504.1 glutaredoxin [Myxococcales bacterium]
MGADLLRRTRILLHGLLTSERGNSLQPVRALRSAVSLLNDLAGRPLCSAEEIRRREQEIAEAEQALRQRGTTQQGAHREVAPVVVYTSEQDQRTPRRIAELLRARNIPFVVLDVTEDEATRSWVLTRAHANELPLVFIAGEPVGGLHELTQLDVCGELVRKVFG